MPTLTVSVPESVHRAARELAAQDGISLDQFIASAMGEKVAVLRTTDYLRERGQGADEKDWDDILAMVPDAEPEEFDRLPASPQG